MTIHFAALELGTEARVTVLRDGLPIGRLTRGWRDHAWTADDEIEAVTGRTIARDRDLDRLKATVRRYLAGG